MTLYIGLDGHSGSCTFVAVNQTGEVAASSRLPTTEGHLLRYVRGLKGPKRLALEESHISQWLFCLLKDEVDELVVCNPVYLGRKQGAKDDYRDGLHLAQELRCGHLVGVHHEDTDLWTLRTLVQAYLDVTRELTQAKNRYKALFLSQAIDVSGRAIYRDKGKIDCLKTSAERFVATSLFERLEHLQTAKAAYVDEFAVYEKRHPQIKRLCSVPGIRLIRAAIITSLVCSPHRFQSKHKFWAYSMLVKYVDMSDGTVYGKRTVQGRRELKAVFDGAALTVLKGESSLRKYYDQLRTKKVAHQAAKKAVARRIAAICLALLKGGGKYDDLHEVKRQRADKKTV